MEQIELQSGVLIEKLNIQKEDTILLKIDPDIISPKACLEIYSKVKGLYPKNKIITTYGGGEISKM